MQADGIVIARQSGACALLVVATIHANWARGSAWPARDERTLAQAVIGHEAMPSAPACLTVAALLLAGAALVAGRPRGWPRLQRLGAAGVAATLAGRGLIGVAGLMPQERTSSTFARWNRHLYSPLCLALAGLCVAGAVPPDAAT